MMISLSRGSAGACLSKEDAARTYHIGRVGLDGSALVSARSDEHL
jgi:hypothetical protein